MENLAEILESQLEQAFELKNKNSLHNYVQTLVKNIVPRTEMSIALSDIRSDIKVIAETMKIGFESFDKRFEEMNKKINMLIWIISLWMTLLTAISFFLKWYQ